MKFRILVIGIIVFLSNSIRAQESVLQKKISVNYSSKSLKEIIHDLSQRYDLHFAYSHKQIDLDRTITIVVENQTLEFVLIEMCNQAGIVYKIIGNQIVLTKKDKLKKSYTISGYIKDKSSGEALIGATIVDKHGLKGMMTNVYGFFSISLPADSVKLMISYMGYDTQVFSFYLDHDAQLVIYLEELNNNLQEVIIEGQKIDRIEQQTQMSRLNIPIEKIKSMPAFLGETDVLKVIQLMPGVQGGTEGSAGIYVRGGSQDQNLFLLDGVPLYNVAHIGNFYSIFNADALNSVELIKGGFPARYGERLSSIIDIRMKDGNTKKYTGQVSISPISGKFMVEGPIVKDKSSFMVSARRSWLDFIFKTIDKENPFAYFYFYDFNTKLNYTLSSRDKIYLSFYSGEDRYASTIQSGNDNTHLESKGGFTWGNTMGALRWNHIFHNKLFSNTTLSYTRYRFMVNLNQKYTKADTIKTSDFSYQSGIQDVTAKIDWEYFPTTNHLVRFGLGTTMHYFTPGVIASLVDDFTQKYDTAYGGSPITAWEYVSYIEDDWEITRKLKINAGFHFAAFTGGEKMYPSLQPRLSLRYLLPDNIALKASYATMWQFMHLLVNSTPTLPTDLWVPATDHIAPQSSHQVALGLAKSLNDNVYEVSLEAYYKTMQGLIEYKEGNSIFTNTQNWEDQVETGGKGVSYGLEFLAQKKYGKLTGWMGYTWSKTTRQFENINQGNSFPYKYDRRHDVEIALTYRLAKWIEISANWIYQTGSAMTLGFTRYPLLQSTGSWHYKDNIEVYEGKNNFRMSPTHRLDVSITFSKQKRRVMHHWSIGAYNLYNRKNPFYYTFGLNDQGYTVLKQVSLFSIVPSFTYSLKF